MILQTERLYTTDVVALSHILNNGYEYQRPEGQRWLRSYLLGESLLSTEGDQHRKQRRAMVSSIIMSVRGKTTDLTTESSVWDCSHQSLN